MWPKVSLDACRCSEANCSAPQSNNEVSPKSLKKKENLSHWGKCFECHDFLFFKNGNDLLAPFFYQPLCSFQHPRPAMESVIGSLVPRRTTHGLKCSFSKHEISATARSSSGWNGILIYNLPNMHIQKKPLSRRHGYRAVVTVVRSCVQASWCPPEAGESNPDRQTAIEENQVPVILSEALGLDTRTRFDYLSGASSAEYSFQQKHAASLRRRH